MTMPTFGRQSENHPMTDEPIVEPQKDQEAEAVNGNDDTEE
jgi:hypothetical protein